MKDRSKSILEASVREFIATGKPVTSEQIYSRYSFGIKPAMIRWELHDLAESGYFYQNHSSGGRIPKDKAYRFFVREILSVLKDSGSADEDSRENSEMSDTSYLLRHLESGKKKEFVRDLSDDLNVFSACCDVAMGAVYDSGFSELLGVLAFHDKKELIEIAEDIEMISDRFCERRKWWQEETEWPQVFVGRNEMTKSRALSVLAGKIISANGDEFAILMIGPKRMDYERSLRLLKELAESDVSIN